MGTELVKRDDEYIWASIFVNQINQEYGFDYILVPESGENSPIDMYVESKSGEFEELKLQLTHAIELPFIAYESSESADFSKKPTIDAIERKNEKLSKQGINLNELILVVQGYMDIETAQITFADEAFEKYQHYDFKGIYYVAPPMMSDDTNESLQDGLVIAIKNAFSDVSSK